MKNSSDYYQYTEAIIIAVKHNLDKEKNAESDIAGKYNNLHVFS